MPSAVVGTGHLVPGPLAGDLQGTGEWAPSSCAPANRTGTPSLATAPSPGTVAGHTWLACPHCLGRNPVSSDPVAEWPEQAGGRGRERGLGRDGHASLSPALCELTPTRPLSSFLTAALHLWFTKTPSGVAKPHHMLTEGAGWEPEHCSELWSGSRWSAGP